MGSSLAFFVSHHGFGHAARACAVIEALALSSPGLGLHIFSAVPEWFFRQSLSHKFIYHPYRVDVGIIQKTTYEEDIPATMAQLEKDIPYSNLNLSPLVQEVQRAACAGIICDISPVGIAVANRIGIPSFLIENFTWDWIYHGYAQNFPALSPFASALHDLFQQAAFLIQSDPVCFPKQADLSLPPISRKPRTPPDLIRSRLLIPAHHRMVVLSLGGADAFLGNLQFLEQVEGVTFVVISPSLPGSQPKNLIHLNPISDFYHPDLIYAADAVIAKAGYSTLAEAYYAGTPFGFLLREKLPESSVLRDYILKHDLGYQIPLQDLYSSGWLTYVEKLLSNPKIPHPADPANQAAQFILKSTQTDR